MASSSSKPTAVHFAMVFFVLVSIILGVLTYVNQKALSEKIVELDKVTKEKATLQAGNVKAIEKIDALKKVIGHAHEDVGEEGTDKANTVIGEAKNELQTYAGENAAANYSQSVQKMAEAYRNAIAERDDMRDKLNKLQEEYVTLESKEKGRVDSHENARRKAEQEVSSVTQQSQETIALKDKTMNELRTSYLQTQQELDAERDARAKEKKELESKLANYSARVRKLEDELQEKRRETFETPDGLIQMVNQDTKTVWINRGEADKLRPRVTFSVYKKGNAGVARGNQDIKGSIEVTKIIGPHLAEARIVKDELHDPISANDPIYTPMWSPGRTEGFAFVGLIDLDSDKHSDRDTLHEIVSAVGARIDTEVDDNAVRTGSKITEKTKFLVVGEIPELSSTNDEGRLKIIKDLFKHKSEMIEEARQHGVQIVSLSDFQSYIGYQPERRLYRPGEQTPFTLKAGARSGSVGETVGNRVSTGQTSAAVSGNQNLRPRTSTGTSSKLFRNGN